MWFVRGFCQRILRLHEHTVDKKFKPSICSSFRSKIWDRINAHRAFLLCACAGRLPAAGAHQVAPVRGKLHRQSCCYRRSSRRFAASHAGNLAATGARPAGSGQATPATLLLQALVAPVRGKLHRQSCCYRRSFRRFAASHAGNLVATGVGRAGSRQDTQRV